MQLSGNTHCHISLLERKEKEKKETDVQSVLCPATHGIQQFWEQELHTAHLADVGLHEKREGAARDTSHGRRVVMEFVEGLQGHNVACDNFFSTSSPEELLRKKQTRTSTPLRMFHNILRYFWLQRLWKSMHQCGTMEATKKRWLFLEERGTALVKLPQWFQTAVLVAARKCAANAHWCSAPRPAGGQLKIIMMIKKSWSPWVGDKE